MYVTLRLSKRANLRSMFLASLINFGSKHLTDCLFKNLLSISCLSSSVKLYSSPCNIVSNLSMAKISFFRATLHPA